MLPKIRKSPPICLVISLFRLAVRRLKISKQFFGSTIQMDNGDNYEIFRYIKTKYASSETEETIFVVSFKFSRFSHNMNKKLSIIPMLLITGFPGFKAKIYAVNKSTGYWQGLYQWESIDSLMEYKKSFVFKLMNRRAIGDTINSFELEKHTLTDYIEGILI